MTDLLVRLSGVSHRFGTVAALEAADLELRGGEVHGLLGENGAGKSTLLRVLGGLIEPDAGALSLNGAPVTIDSPRQAWDLGIGLVHQHFALVPRLTVAENLTLGRRVGASGWRLPITEIREQAVALIAETGLTVPLDSRVDSLGVGDRQRVEILKALLRNPRIVALDEPTAVLAPSEVEGLFVLLRRLAAEGRAVVIVAHKLDEILSVADRVTVLRGGRSVLSAARSQVDAKLLISAMVGAPGAETGARLAEQVGAPIESGWTRADEAHSVGEIVASCRDAMIDGPHGRGALDSVSLEIRRGEIVGIAGVDGNGQRELALLFGGRLAATAGVCDLPQRVGFVPQDRTDEGLVLDFDLTENVALLEHRLSPDRVLDWPAMRASAERIRVEYGIRAADTGVAAKALSGGNQQRLVVGRELGVAADLLVIDNPTRGLDVASASFVHRILRERVAGPEAPGVLLLSTDLDEILALADRLFAMVRGRLVEVPSDSRTREGIGRVMLSGTAT